MRRREDHAAASPVAPMGAATIMCVADPDGKDTQLIDRQLRVARMESSRTR